MTGASPIITQNAINFTPDNLRCYAYSGLTPITDSETTMLEFQTNSEYIIGILQINYIAVSSVDVNYKIYINDQMIQGYLGYETAGGTEPDSIINILIPPFSTFKVTGTAASGSLNHVATFTGRAYGMTETGYQ